jgi:hypothetical protein
MFDSIIEQIVSNSKNNDLINDYRWRKAEVQRLHRRSTVDSLEVGKTVDLRTREYVWHPAVVKRMRVDPFTQKRMLLLALVVLLTERASL